MYPFCFTNCVDPYQTPRFTVYDLGLHYSLMFVQKGFINGLNMLTQGFLAISLQSLFDW